MYFIYSSNSVELNKPLSLSIHQKPLYSVLETLSEIMQVTFRREGNYVVVKATNEIKSPVPVPNPRSTQKKEAIVKNISTVEAPTISETKKTFLKVEQLSIPSELLKKNLIYCSLSNNIFNSTPTKIDGPLHITNPRPRRFAFTSINLMANEFSGGLEIHIGIPSLYAVVNAGVMQGGYFRNGYGLGTSIPIKPKISLTPIYTFARVNREEDYVIDNNLNLVINDGLKLTGKHHQAKFLFQIQAFKQVRLHVGPSLNFLKTSYIYARDAVFYDVNTSSQPVYSTGYYGTSSRVRIVRTISFTPPSDYSTFKSWIGFEAGISYSIKFPHR